MAAAVLPDLTTELGPLTLQSPLILASSPWGWGAEEAAELASSGIGALTAKSVGPAPRIGHSEPTIYDWGEGLINAVGLANPGAEAAVEGLLALKAALKRQGVSLIVSIFADTVDRYHEVAETIAQVEPEMVEVNISCPNVEAEFGAPFATECPAAAAATAAARSALACPLSVKLAPNVPNLVQIAEAVVGAGADMLTVSNTMPGMVIDVEARKPVLSNITGGLSGEALRPVAVRMVYELHRAFGGEVPIIGTGGVLRGRDAIEMVMAGATAVGMATVALRHGPAGVRRVLTELDEWMSDHGVETLAEIRGVVG
ncbi:MAG: dihydroorotate dehydrogenase [Aggregatilineales bacterium]|nr:dihydroorotate dehydrogenase [Chloroflexota bacterium]HOA24444.1 dihydroorotate dehydrogenase [Aggregatilineales bacterium]HPV06280.1 dihydroorotate dehydrogenase [Aggregatilineales bacterium]